METKVSSETLINAFNISGVKSQYFIIQNHSIYVLPVGLETKFHTQR